MEKRISTSSSANDSKKIYITMVGSAPMASLDALVLSLERFKSILSSDSAKERFETTVRTIKSSLKEIDQFLDGVYAEKNPNMTVTMKGRTLIIEVGLSKEKFLDCIYNEKVEEILSHVHAVGTMPVKKLPNQSTREYLAFPIRYTNGRFIK